MGVRSVAPTVLAAMRDAIERVKARGGTVSFDPNIRKELAKGSDLAAFFDFVLDRCRHRPAERRRSCLLLPVRDEERRRCKRFSSAASARSS